VAAAALAGMAGVAIDTVDNDTIEGDTAKVQATTVDLSLSALQSGDLLDRWVEMFKADQKGAVAAVITMILQVHPFKLLIKPH
jgi:hypothetical protein